MSAPNSAARNAMTDSERTIYNWGLEDGRESERKRIIKLLEEYLADYDISWNKNIPELIALIKGEQK